MPEHDAHGNKTGKRIKGSLKNNLEYMDYLIGQIWTQVVAEGLDQKTILVVAGDNGTGRLWQRTADLGSRVARSVHRVWTGAGETYRALQCPG